MAEQPDLGSSSEPLVTKATSLDTHERSVLNREDAVGSVTACRDEPASPLLPGLERDAERYLQVQKLVRVGTDAATGKSLLRIEIHCPSVDLFKGSIVGHFDTAIDAEISRLKGEGSAS